jgi:predicted transposase/invertase (TIGR01784 family)
MFDYVTSDPQTRELIRIREAGRHDYVSDINSAKREGIALGKRELARNLLKNNVDISVIADSSGLSIEEIKSLR